MNIMPLLRIVRRWKTRRAQRRQERRIRSLLSAGWGEGRGIWLAKEGFRR